MGWWDVNASLSSDFGSSPGGYVYLPNGQKKNNGTASAYGATYAAGDIISVLFTNDGAGNFTVTFWKNGVSQGTAFSFVHGATSWGAVFNANTNDSVHANFGGEAFTYTPPAGYTGLPA